MTKRSSTQQERAENQADLFGAPGVVEKKAREARHNASSLTKPAPTLTPRRVIDQTLPEALLNVRQAAARLGLSKSTLDKMRKAGKGPRFVKSTDRAIRYDRVDLDRWISARRSTSE